MIHLFTENKQNKKETKIKIPGVLYEGDNGSWNNLPCPNSSCLFQEPSASHLGLQIGSLAECRVSETSCGHQAQPLVRLRGLAQDQGVVTFPGERVASENTVCPLKFPPDR